MNVLLLAPRFPFSDEWHSAFAEVMPDVHFVAEGQVDSREITAAVVYEPPARILSLYPNLRAVIVLGAGVDRLLADDTLPNVPVIRLANSEMAALMTEFVVYSILRSQKRFQELERIGRQGRWQPMPDRGPAAYERVSILGLGRLGLPCAVALRDLGFRVSGWSTSPKVIPGIQTFTGPVGLAQLLSQTTILVCLLPLTAATRGLLSSDLFFSLPRGAQIINVGRGECLNEVDLCDALARGQISHVQSEPLPDTHPFWADPRVTITPHAAANPGARACALEIAEILRRLRGGETLCNVVDRQRGY